MLLVPLKLSILNTPIERKDTAKRTDGLHIVKIRSPNGIKGKTKSVSILAPTAHRHNSRQGKLDTQERENTD